LLSALNNEEVIKMLVLNFIATNILGNPAILFALIALTGLILLKKSFPDIMLGVIRTVIGYLILVIGVAPLLAATTPISTWVGDILGVKGVIPQNWIIMSTATAKYGPKVALAVLVGFVINLLLARFTKLKYIALTGQILVIWAAFAVGVLGIYDQLSTFEVVLIAGTFCGIYNWLAVAVSHYFMKKSGRMTDEWGLYVTEISGIAITSWLSAIIGNKDKRCDEIKVPEWMEWIRDTTVSVTIISMILWTILGLIAGKHAVEALSAGQNWIIYLIFLGFNFGAGLTIVLFGVRMMLAELVPAFKGIATRLIPGAIPGFDYPTVFQFAPTAVFLGFVVNLAGGILATVIMVAIHMPVIMLPAVWMNFWTGGMLGVFADAYGGIRATLIVCFVMGLIVPFGWALAYPLSGFFVSTHATADYTDTATIGYLYELLVHTLFGK
jgi:PTS system ascorbate-specific IIC component